MKLVPIFGVSNRTLLAIQYDGEKVDEFKKAFSNWSNVEYLWNFFREHKRDILDGYYRCKDIREAISETQKYSNELESLIYKKADGNADQIENMLQSIFEPLNNNELNVYELQKSKLKRKWIRIYAIRIAQNRYIVTGSAIKLVQRMNERDYLLKELQNLERVKEFLKENGLIDEESIDFLELKG